MLDLNKDKLVCMIVIDDVISERTSNPPVHVNGCVRAFVLQDRSTQEVNGMWRWKYSEEKRSWHGVVPWPRVSLQADIDKLVSGLTGGFKALASKAGLDPDVVVTCHFPPDDEGDPLRTILWLEKNDLMEIKVVDINTKEKSVQ